MKPDSEAMKRQVEQNFDAISQKTNEYIPVRVHQYALMRDGEVIEFYSCREDAYKTGAHFFKEDGLFSVQQVTRSAVDLGYFSHAVHLG